ncbi:MAG: NADH-quinone oxidoreductase subunit L, partial [Candidatus Accumulibacter sp.]|nr:NADH-quinone oxidoreductase subunit L [Accumulibacter sp.]
VIIGMHHDQDIRNMGGLRKYMPITWFTSLIGSLALIGTPFFSGFYSKDSIIEAVALSHIPGSGFAYFAVLASVFVTAFYSFRMYFLVFHGEERFGKAAHHQSHAAHSPAGKHAADKTAAHDEHAAHGDDARGDDAHGEEHHGLAPGEKPHETPWVVTLPLIMLAIPSVFIGYVAIEPMLFGDFFKGSIVVDAEAHPVMEELAHHFHGAFAMATHAVTTSVFWLALLGVASSWFLYMKRPDIPEAIKSRFAFLYTVLDNKYYFDKFNEAVFAGGARLLGRGLWKGGDVGLIDGIIVGGSVRLVSWFATLARFFQTGHIYHYAFTMIIGVFVLMTLWVTRA